MKTLVVTCGKCGLIKKIVNRVDEMMNVDVGGIVSDAMRAGDSIEFDNHHILDGFCSCEIIRRMKQDG